MFSVGLVGLPNAGKSTLFNLLTKIGVAAENFPFCTIDPNNGTVLVPDERITTLSKLTGSQKEVFAMIEFVDIAGLVKGAASGAGLGNQFLAHIRQTDLILLVVRAFEGQIIHTENRVNPKEDEEILLFELICSDEEIAKKSLVRLEKEAKKDPHFAVKLDILNQILEQLKLGKLASNSLLGLENPEEILLDKIEKLEEIKKLVENLS